MARIKGGAGEE
jgi:hypothetical protein